MATNEVLCMLRSVGVSVHIFYSGFCPCVSFIVAICVPPRERWNEGIVATNEVLCMLRSVGVSVRRFYSDFFPCITFFIVVCIPPRERWNEEKIACFCASHHLKGACANDFLILHRHRVLDCLYFAETL